MLSEALNRFISKIFIIAQAVKEDSYKCIFNLKGSSTGALLSQSKENFIYIDRNEESAKRIYQDILFWQKLFGPHHPEVSKKSCDFLECPKAPELIFIPDGESPLSEGIRSNFMLEKGEDILRNTLPFGLILSESTIDSILWRPEYLKTQALFLRIGLEIERLTLIDRLISIGYRKTPFIVERGDFCVKNFVIEVFPSTEAYPVRVEFFGDQIDSIKRFEIETQKSFSDLEELTVLPAKPPERSKGIQFREWLNSLPKSPLIFVSEELHGKDQIPGSSIILSSKTFGLPMEKSIDAGLLSLAGLGILFSERKTIEELAENLKPLLKKNTILIVTKTLSQAKRLRDILFEHDIVTPELCIEDVRSYKGNIAIVPSGPDLSISSGLYLEGFILLTDHELFGPRPSIGHPSHYRVSKLFTEIDDLEEGDFVVHKIHGIGIYRGVQRLKIENLEEDVLTIEYKNSAKLHLPMRNISMIHKFRAQEGIIPEVDVLGGKTWQKTRQKVEAKIKELARKLLRLYAEREISGGYAFSPEGEYHREFASFFEFEETPDQLKAIEETLYDMEQPRPMERLIVGDVGYGKTEVAMRAAFKAVFDGKQVAVLVPTTILAEQHFRTFRQRFSAFPVKIDYLSRFKSTKEQKKTIEALAKGEIDIIIGTHSLLSERIKFFDLGLLIIDEEHRFGVRHKERLKELKKGVDVLLLSATPIPRTLQMALSGIKNMSVIETPPPDRFAVKTIITVFKPEVIRDAIETEINRGGQVFFIHNRIKDIEDIKEFITKLISSIRIGIAHGQMDEKLIEEVMLKLINKEIELLICTNIIGSGIDIPSANTIIINRAHEFGLADLYQLRGRVGRSNIKAYAYLLIPGDEVITEAAKKRLEAISEMSYLGAGIRLAMTDLEIRGAGNILGKEQSGQINTIGFELYSELLAKAIRELKGEKTEEPVDPIIQINLPARIPESYVEDIHLRLNLYRRLSLVQTEDELTDIEEEIEDRFGPLPAEAKNLIKIVEFKILAKKLRIEKIVIFIAPKVSTQLVEIYFGEELKRELLEQLFTNSGDKVPPAISKTEHGKWLNGLVIRSVGSKKMVLSTERKGREVLELTSEFLKICSSPKIGVPK